MSDITADKDYDNLTFTLVTDLAAAPERVWQLWADPRQLERWWGPPSHPATVEEHDLTPGGTVTYFMTAPDGERFRGWWRVLTVDPPKGLEFVDGFADADGNPATDLPTNNVQVTLTPRDGGTRMRLTSVFESREQMDRLMEMGMDEGGRQALAQVDALLAG